MITAKTANNKAFEAKEAKELLKEKHYLEVLKHVELLKLPNLGISTQF